LPGRSNAIYRLAAGLVRLGQFDFPMELNDTTRLYLQRAADFEDPKIGADMKAVAAPNPDPAAVARLSAIARFNAQIRTTCVATMLEGGHAENALPQLARALVNCRVLPGHSRDEVKRALDLALADDRIEVKPVSLVTPSPASPITPEVFGAIEKLAGEFWPGAPVIPVMSAGASDGAFMRNAGIATYGHSGLASDVSENRAHGRDERVPVNSFYQGVEYLYRLAKTLGGGR
jgi:acetylornithine deacetylase/succinyl-diaminopimelate desuccinylase-like protein